MSKVRLLRWTDAVVAVLVALVSLKAVQGMLGTFDVILDDETLYLDQRHPGRFVPAPEGSPLYPFWYRLLALFEPDSLRLYFLNWYVLSLALPIALYALARRSGAPRFAASTISVAWGVSNVAYAWPFITKFVALLLALGALATTYVRDGVLRLSILSIVLSFAAFARPELYVPSIALVALCTVYGTVVVVRDDRSWRKRSRSIGVVAAAIGAAIGLRLHFGSPMAEGRSFYAFGQHYALKVALSQHLGMDPWTNWLVIARRAFPHAETIGAAARENPREFIWHLTQNLRALPAAFAELLLPPSYVPECLRAAIAVALVLVLVLGLAGASFFRRRSRRRFAPPRLSWWPLLIVVAVPTTASVILIHPRQHYILPFSLLALGALATWSGRSVIAMKRAFRRRTGPRWRAGVGSVAHVATLAVFLALFPTFRRSAAPALLSPVIEPARHQENLLTIAALRSYRLKGPLTVLETSYSRALYAGYDFRYVSHVEKYSKFWDFLHARGVNVVCIDARMTTHLSFTSDPEFLSFADGSGEREDFQFFEVPGTTRRIAVRRSILPSP